MDITKLKNVYQTDPVKEIQGFEVHLGEGFYVKVARTRNPEADKLFQRLISQPEIEMARRAGALDDETMRKIVLEQYSKTILVGWRGLTEGDKEIPYSSAKALELLMMQDFFDKIFEIAKTQENYRQDAVAGAADKLGKL